MGTLTKRQHDFCIAYVENRNIYKSAIDAGYSTSYAKSKGHLLLKNPAILEHVTHLSETHYQKHFEQIGLTAIKNLSDVVSDAENRSTQLSAIKYVLSAIGAGATEDDAGTIHIKVRLPDGL